jgi:hypothetical protein
MCQMASSRLKLGGKKKKAKKRPKEKRQAHL